MERRWRQVANRFIEFGQFDPIFRVVGPLRGGGVLREVRLHFPVRYKMEVHLGLKLVGGPDESGASFMAGMVLVQRMYPRFLGVIGPFMVLGFALNGAFAEMRFPLAVRVPTGSWYVMVALGSSVPELHGVLVSVIVEGGIDAVSVVDVVARNQ